MEDDNSASNVPEPAGKFKKFYNECIRVLKVTKKPNKNEYMTVAKVAAVGLLIIGLLGFLLFALKQLIIS
jgi:protein transport protein SEC61 subunit gamma-like protein